MGAVSASSRGVSCAGSQDRAHGRRVSQDPGAEGGRFPLDWALLCSTRLLAPLDSPQLPPTSPTRAWYTCIRMARALHADFRLATNDEAIEQRERVYTVAQRKVQLISRGERRRWASEDGPQATCMGQEEPSTEA